MGQLVIATAGGRGGDYLQTFFIRSNGAVGHGETHTTVPDGVEGLVTESSGLGRHIRFLGAESQESGIGLLRVNAALAQTFYTTSAIASCS